VHNSAHATTESNIKLISWNRIFLKFVIPHLAKILTSVHVYSLYDNVGPYSNTTCSSKLEIFNPEEKNSNNIKDKGKLIL
jgi:hypothetical protein